MINQLLLLFYQIIKSANSDKNYKICQNNYVKSHNEISSYNQFEIEPIRMFP